MKRILMTVLMSAYVIASARGQGFLNLDFSLAHNLPSSPGIEGLSVSVTNALPDWNAYEGEKVLSSIYYVSNNFSSAYTLVELEGGTLALGGNNFGVGLFGGSISQTAQVPNNAESLEFETPSDLNLRVDLGGERLLLSEISANSNYNVYGANLPAGLAGQVETLTFYENGSQTVLDGIVFSSSPIPEPGEGALLGLGALVWGVYWRRSRTERRKY
jgi:hypothetical protein